MNILPLSASLDVGIAIASGTVAQQTLHACESQQEPEQIISSQGEIHPDGCRTVSVSILESTAGRLCVIDFSSEGGGIVDQLQDVATTQQWWVQCDDLDSASALI